MRAPDSWSYSCYKPPLFDDAALFINRIAPKADSVHLEWNPLPEENGTLYWRRRGEAAFTGSLPVSGSEADITGLEDHTEYEVQLTCGGEHSRVRLVRTGAVEGTVVNYLHPEDDAFLFSGRYLCSPCLLRHPDGHLLASMDVYQGGAPQNLEMIFRSDDDGKTWHYQTELFPCFWGRMFIHQGALYMIGVSTEYGDLLIGRSDDGGKTFSPPTVLLRGSGRPQIAGVHKNPMPPARWRGRVWHTLEWGCWADRHSPMMGSYPEDADPLDASAWRFTAPLPYDPAWPGTARGKSNGCIEGNALILPDGNLYDIMRYDMMNCTPDHGRILAFRVDPDDPEAPLAYSRAIEFPANHSKFIIRRDPETGMYYTICSRILDSAHRSARNLLSFMKSPDGEHWTLAADLLDRRHDDMDKIGFQYVDWFMEGEDILWLCRTADNGAHNFHDANYSVFHRLSGFRRL